MKKLLYIMSLATVLTVPGQIVSAQPFDRLPKEKQDSILIEIAKRTVMEYGPDWYRDKFPPEITQPDNLGGYSNDQNLEYDWYMVTFLYDKNEEFMYANYSVKVAISKATLSPEKILFGNNKMIHIDQLPKTRSGEKPVMPYVPMVKRSNPPPKLRVIDIDTGKDITPE